MCQFKTILISAAGSSCTTCCCKAGAAVADALGEILPERVEKIFTRLMCLTQLPSPVAEASVNKNKYSSAMTAELELSCQTDCNNKSRSSRLKIARSLPCSDKRRVQFADDLGQPLTDVRLFELRSQLVKAEVELPLDLLVQYHFEQPSAGRALLALTGRSCSVHLSGFTFRLNRVGRGASMTGYALVNNLSFHKRVFVRITADSWCNFTDLDADYVGSLDDKRDAFQFELRCDIEELELEFCVCFETHDRDQHWDSNGGANYRVSLVKPRRIMLSA